ncbi:MAG: ABC transporter permease subunit [Mycobacteriales bacterium]
MTSSAVGWRAPRAWRLVRRDGAGELAMLVALVVAVQLLPKSIPVGIYGLGVVSGGYLALQALGVVLVYRTNGFLNLAQVQIGATAATLFTVLVRAQPLLRGVRRVCPPCVPNSAAATDVNYLFALLLALAFSVLVAWLVYFLVVRRFAQAPRLILTVASIFLVQVLAALQHAAVYLLTTPHQRLLDGVTSAAPPPVNFHLHLYPATFAAPDVLAVLAAIAAVVGMTAYLRFSRTGTALRAAAEHPDRARTLGVNVGRVNGRIWLLVGLLSGVPAILGAMSAPTGDGTDPAAPASLVLILAVAVVARLTSLWLAGLAALVFGVVLSGVVWSYGSATLVQGGLVVVICGLFLVQRYRAGRADSGASDGSRLASPVRPVPASLRALPGVRRYRRITVLVIGVVLLGYPFVTSPGQTAAGVDTLILAIVGMSLLVLTGWAGQVSLGQFAFAAIGGYVAAVSGLPMLAALPVGALAGALAAGIVGLPALKLRGLHLAVSTLAFAVAVSAVLLDPTSLGRYLPASLPSPVLFGVSLADPTAFYYFALAVLALSVVAVAGLRASRTCRVLIAGRDNPPATQALGVDLVRSRLLAFCLSGFLAALAGVLFAYQVGGVRADTFSVQESITVFTFTVIGGLGSLSGPLIGFACYGVFELAAASPFLIHLLTGLGGLVLLVLAPSGLAQVVFGARDAVLRRTALRRGLVVPELLGDQEADAGPRRAPIVPKVRPGGGAVYVPARYSLDGQWLAERTGVTAGAARD